MNPRLTSAHNSTYCASSVASPTMKMITIPPPASPCEVKYATALDSDTVSTGDSLASIEKQTRSFSFSSEKDGEASPSTPPPRRSIFNSYWRKHSSSISFKDDDNGSEGSGREVKRSPRLDPSYLGVYSFAPPSPLLSPKPPALSPVSSTDSLTPSPVRPKSILRRHRSLLLCRGVSPVEGSRRVNYFGPGSNTKSQFDIVPPLPLLDHASEGSDLSKASSSREPDLKRQHSFVHFDPTITIRECVREEPKGDQKSNWFSQNELRTFMAETVHLCHSSAVEAAKTYSLPAVKKSYDSAHIIGVKNPILSSYPEYRALFADPALHAADEDAVVHDGSKRFFKIMSREIQRVLIVDNSPTTLKLFHKHILSMFPHVQIDTAVSGEDALDKIEVDTNYDLIIVEERLQQRHSGEKDDLTGSELLRLINEMESSASFHRNDTNQERGAKPSKIPSRRSLKIGVSVSLGEDCECLRNKGGADVFWSKPPPKPSNALRNQVMNALLSKRGKSVFICGC